MKREINFEGWAGYVPPNPWDMEIKEMNITTVIHELSEQAGGSVSLTVTTVPYPGRRTTTAYLSISTENGQSFQTNSQRPNRIEDVLCQGKAWLLHIDPKNHTMKQRLERIADRLAVYQGSQSSEIDYLCKLAGELRSYARELDEVITPEKCDQQ